MALNPDAIPTNEQVRETLFDRFYYPYQKQIWAAFILFTLAVVGYLGLREVQTRRLNEQWDRYYAALELGREGTGMGNADADRQGADQRIPVLTRLAEEFPSDAVTPWALMQVAISQADAGRHDEALAAIQNLQKRFPDFPLFTESADAGPGGARRSLADRFSALLASDKQWAAMTAYTHPQPSTKVTALVETSVGNFWLGFYDEFAPDHVANFIQKAKDGYFNGTQVYHLRTGGSPDTPTPMLFEGGSLASKFGDAGFERDPSLHDRDEPGAILEPEGARYRVRHHRGTITSVITPSGESAQRFMVVTAERGLERYDGQNTPFAAVLDREGSLQTIDRINLSTTYGTHADTKNDPEVFRMRDHPYPTIWIRRVSIWTDEKVAAGHSWDTSRAATQNPEPWEANLPAAPKPSEFAPKAPKGPDDSGK